MRFIRTWLVAVILAASLTACASQPKDGEPAPAFQEIADPLEPLNRTIFDLNLLVDDLVLRPIAEPYRELLVPGALLRITAEGRVEPIDPADAQDAFNAAG